MCIRDRCQTKFRHYSTVATSEILYAVYTIAGKDSLRNTKKKEISKETPGPRKVSTNEFTFYLRDQTIGL